MNLTAWFRLVELLTPLILACVPGLQHVAGVVAAAIQTAEQIPGATGPQKQQIVIALARAGICVANTAAGRDVVDPTLPPQVLAAAVDQIVSITNRAHVAAGVGPASSMS